MAFDFPNTPSTGQRVTGAGGIVYVWDGVKWTSSVGNLTVQSMGDIGRNLLHNPLFNVAQRGAGGFTANAAYTADRWQIVFSGGSSTVALGAMPDGSRTQIGDEAATTYLNNNFAGTVGASDYNFLQQPIEGVRRLAGKTVTLSLYANAGSGTPKLGASIVQIFGTGGSPSAAVTVNGQPAFTLSTSWQRYSMTFTLPSSAGKTLGTAGNDSTTLRLWFSAGSNTAVESGNVGVQTASISLWGIQLEIGSVATPLEKPDLRYDLANCQRFYHVGSFAWQGYSPATAISVGSSWTFPVAMRAIPTMVVTADSVSTGMGARTLLADNAMFGRPNAVSGANGGWAWLGTYSASADL